MKHQTRRTSVPKVYISSPMRCAKSQACLSSSSSAASASCRAAMSSSPASVSAFALAHSALNLRMLYSASCTGSSFCNQTTRTLISSALSNRYQRERSTESAPRAAGSVQGTRPRERVKVDVSLEVGLLQPPHELERHVRVHRPTHHTPQRQAEAPHRRLGHGGGRGGRCGVVALHGLVGPRR